MSPDALVNQLLSIVQTQEANTALTALEEAVRHTTPTDPRILLLLASQYAALGQTDAAEASYTALLQMAPDFAIARFQLGLLQFTCGRPAVAIATWGPLEQLPSDHYLRAFVQGFWFLSQDEFEKACNSLQMGIALNQDNPALNHDMHMMLEHIRAQQLSATPSATEPSPVSDEDTHDSQHFLLSGYTRLH